MKTHLSVVLAAVAAAICAPSFAAGLPGRLDPDFGGAGRQVVPVALDTGGALNVTTSVLGPDGAVHLVGTRVRDDASLAIALARLDAHGTIDTAFGEGGVVTVEAVAFTEARVRDAVFDAQGRLLVAGEASVDGSDAMFACRLAPDGTLDPGFGLAGSGCWQLALDGAGAQALLVQHGTGRVILAGSVLSNGNSLGVLLALTGDGAQVDTSFGAGFGLQFVPWSQLPKPTRFLALAQDASGQLAAAGSHTFGPGDEDFLLLRLDVDGQPAPGFADAGFVISSFDLGADNQQSRDEATAVLLLDDGSLLVAGHAQVDATTSRPALLRLMPDAAADETFVAADSTNDKGPGFADYTACAAPCAARFDDVRMTPDGQWVLAGTVTDASGEDLLAMRIYTTGAPDVWFGDGSSGHAGVARIGFDAWFQSPASAQGYGVLLQEHGVLVAGTVVSDADADDQIPAVAHFAIVRLGNGGTVFLDGFE